jgi:hypothetical protein
VVASVTGEPPGRLRLCVLLERAAYRLLATRRTVLDSRLGLAFYVTFLPGQYYLRHADEDVGVEDRRDGQTYCDWCYRPLI